MMQTYHQHERNLMRPIETKYRGVTFKSRMEARWAVWFDEMEWTWIYESKTVELENGLIYTPDFWLETHECHAEVKPCFPTALEMKKIRSLPECLLLIEVPDYQRYWLLTRVPFNETLMLLDNPPTKAPMERHAAPCDFSIQYHRAIEKAQKARFDGYDNDRETIKRRYQ